MKTKMWIVLFYCMICVLSISQEIKQADQEGLTILLGTAQQNQILHHYTLEEIKQLSTEKGWGGIITTRETVKGPFYYQGFSLIPILGTIIFESTIQFEADDGYTLSLPYKQLKEGNFTTFNSSTKQKEEPKIPPKPFIILTEKGTLQLGILTHETQVINGHYWIQNLRKIYIIPIIKSWTLKLEGAINTAIDMNTFEAGSSPSCHGLLWTDSAGDIWHGIALWRLVGMVDDVVEHPDPNGLSMTNHGKAFNATKANNNEYEIHILSNDGSVQKFSSAEACRNENIIIAYQKNHAPLSEELWPLALVGPNLQERSSKKIVCIKLIFANK